MEMEEKPKDQIDFDTVLEALLDTSVPFPPKYLYRLTDLEGEDLAALSQTWSKIDPLRRQRLIEDLEMLSETNFVVLFDSIYMLALTDTDQNIKKTAIRALWESEDKEVGKTLLAILNANTDSVPVIAQATTGLGKFVYLGEFEEIPESLYRQVLDILLEKTADNQPEIVRQRAIESLGFASSPQVNRLIESAYQKDIEDWTISALIAMGRSCRPQWTPMVIESLTHQESRIRLEAAQAAGKIGDPATAEHILHLLDDPDEEVRQAAIWSLSEIGGDDAKLALETAHSAAEDDEEIQLLEEALENLDFTEMALNFDLFDLTEDDLEDMFDTDNLEELGDEED